VLPQELRDDLGLSPGTVLTIEEKSGGILLKPISGRSGLVRKEGILVFAGEVEGDVTTAVQRDREERARKASGLG
jgi:bifunctional DNA-binding transcriptional regulator/antitoxin component of YhaV-PrlF toxin-antitoxin module